MNEISYNLNFYEHEYLDEAYGLIWIKKEEKLEALHLKFEVN